MKRQATDQAESTSLAKVSKESNGDDVGTLARADTLAVSHSESSRSRQRKAPSWMTNYVTGSTPKNLAKAVAVENSTKKGQSTTAKKNGVKEDSKVTEIKSSKKITAKPSPEVTNFKKLDKPHTKLKVKGSVATNNVKTYTKSLPVLKSAVPKAISSAKNIKVKTSLSCTGTDKVTEICDTSISSKFDEKKETLDDAYKSEPPVSEIPNGDQGSQIHNGSLSSSRKMEAPTMLEVVICISTSGAMQEYLEELQASAREMVWRLQSLVPNLRIGVFAHTQGGIHDDKRPAGSPGSPSNTDHNYIRTGGHSGTKWLDLGASFSQICAFVSSLEPEANVYPDYVQDNLEMALWKLQRCMSWSSCSYRTVIMLGRGRPNSPQFYLQREHWRGWIRSALELGSKMEIPVIDWKLEARMLAQMGIHVFTLQGKSEQSTDIENDEEEGTKFFRETAAVTNGQYFSITEASILTDVMLGVCCACYGPELLQQYRDELRDLNDGVMPPNLRDTFISLGLHSKRRSLQTIPSVVDLQAIQSKMKAADLSNGRLFSSSEEDEPEGGMSQAVDHLVKAKDVKITTKTINSQIKAGKGAARKFQTVVKKVNGDKVTKPVKNGKIEKKQVKNSVAKKVVQTVKKLKEKKAAAICSKKVLNGPAKINNTKNAAKKPTKPIQTKQPITKKKINIQVKKSPLAAKNKQNSQVAKKKTTAVLGKKKVSQAQHNKTIKQGQKTQASAKSKAGQAKLTNRKSVGSTPKAKRTISVKPTKKPLVKGKPNVTKKRNSFTAIKSPKSKVAPKTTKVEKKSPVAKGKVTNNKLKNCPIKKSPKTKGETKSKISKSSSKDKSNKVKAILSKKLIPAKKNKVINKSKARAVSAKNLANGKVSKTQKSALARGSVKAKK